MKSVLLILIVQFCCTISVYSADENWVEWLKSRESLSQITKIKLLKSTKKEVEKILGSPEVFDYDRPGFTEYYSTKFGRVTVSYTDAVCETRTQGKIPKGIVEEVGIRLAEPWEFSSLKIPISEFVKTPENDVEIDMYFNPKHGLEFAIYQEKLVTNIYFEPGEAIGLDCFPD